MSSISIQKIGITKLKADAVVNAANMRLAEGAGVCGYIFQDAGSADMTKACSKYGHCDEGAAVITPGFKLPAKYVIHAVGPRWTDGKHNEPELLYSAYKKSLELAKENGLHSIGFPLISAGIFGYPKEQAWKVALSACSDFLVHNDYEIDIIFTVLDDKIIAIGQPILDSMNIGGAIIAENIDLEYKKATHEERVEVFKDTMDWIESDSDLADSVVEAKKATTVYYEDDYPAFDASKIASETITISGDRTFQAAMRLAREMPRKKIAVMNFANAFHAGGGVKKGSSAQEESLCRTSTLYPVLYTRYLRDTYYKHNNDHRNLNKNAKSTDALVYSEGIIICKTDEEFPKRMPKEDWVTVDVITIAAPDLRTKTNIHVPLVGNGTYMNDAELFGYHVKRAIHMLTVAASKGADILVLGAFGCGAFENKPEVVARAYDIALKEFPKVFERIEFAVYCPPGGSKNYDVFKKIFGKYLEKWETTGGDVVPVDIDKIEFANKPINS